MPKAPRKKTFTKIFDDLQKVIDVDDSAGRSVPVNMNFTETGYLTKDTGTSLYGAVSVTEVHSQFNYKKKNGDSYYIRANGTKLQQYNTSTDVWDDLTPTYTAGARFGFYVYDDELYGCNGVENYFKWDGTTFTEYSSAPKGNVLEVFEDRMFVTGVSAEPNTVYYSNVGDATTFTSTDVVNPLGTDNVMTLNNYYGVLMIFKRDSIWKLTFVYDQVASAYLPKLEQQSGNYGACSRLAVSWVENDLWFFTGTEVRSIGYADQQTGVFGINKTVISDPIKETLKLITEDNKSLVSTFYHNRKFYLSVPLSSSTANDTVFVSHLLYKNLWTKYTSRLKSSVIDFIEIDDVIYTTKSSADYGVIKWDTTQKADNGTSIASEVFFRQVENEDFNTFNTYRYLDLMFKDLEATITVTIKQDASDVRTLKTGVFFVGNAVEGEENSLGEVPPGQSLVADSFGESVASAPFLKKRVSFLSKAQSLTIGLSNDSDNESFTIAAYALTGLVQPRRLFAGSKITSV